MAPPRRHPGPGPRHHGGPRHHHSGGRRFGGGRFGGNWYGPPVGYPYPVYCDPIYDPYCRLPYYEINGAAVGALPAIDIAKMLDLAARAAKGDTQAKEQLNAMQAAIATEQQGRADLPELWPGYGLPNYLDDASACNQGLEAACARRKAYEVLMKATPPPEGGGPTIPKDVRDTAEAAAREAAQGRLPGAGTGTDSGAGAGTGPATPTTPQTPPNLGSLLRPSTRGWGIEFGPIIAGVPSALDYAIGDIGYAEELSANECHCHDARSNIVDKTRGAYVGEGYGRDQPGWRDPGQEGVWIDQSYARPRTEGDFGELASNEIYHRGPYDSLDRVLEPVAGIG
jgi:hypothetical protein